ncbi:ABC transporter ATP-binding protein [Clostridioides difficile]|nr:ABC transporter ATP-binding protein [Clostridioides difficile]MBY1826158.1 ABC transporter ATP-binding protein [Clostridioides difficile]MDB6345777.1 ABC transporter ATP-binding protein [Clostridioides difficile]HDN2438872.1 ABC transporter ATP-binding protein [Clostridioides difficile]
MINISLRNISKNYKNKIILENINLDIESSKIYMILGKSGAGKSTLLNIIGLLDTQSSGNISIKGKVIKNLNDNDKADIRMKELGFVFQGCFLNQKLKVYENVTIPMYINNLYKNIDLKNRSIELLKIFGLEDKYNSFPNELSGGEQQRVAIARAIANDASVIVADEPTGNLDKENEQKVMEYFKYLSSVGKSIIMVTHNKNLLEYADKVFYLRNGKLEEFIL